MVVGHGYHGGGGGVHTPARCHLCVLPAPPQTKTKTKTKTPHVWRRGAWLPVAMGWRVLAMRGCELSCTKRRQRAQCEHDPRAVVWRCRRDTCCGKTPPRRFPCTPPTVATPCPCMYVDRRAPTASDHPDHQTVKSSDRQTIRPSDRQTIRHHTLAHHTITPSHHHTITPSHHHTIGP